MKIKELNLQLEVFEGPLDLLLHLIKTLKIDVYDIPITEVTYQYLAYLHDMRTLQLEVAGEYMVMAATLMSIKSKMLLPKQEIEISDEFFNENDGNDPRDSLVTQLIEYKKFKHIALELKNNEMKRQSYFTKEPSDLSEFKENIIEIYPPNMPKEQLYLSFIKLLNKRNDTKNIKLTVKSENNTIENTMVVVSHTIQNLYVDSSKILFESLLNVYSLENVILTFLAILELMKSQKIEVIQREIFNEIIIKPTELLLF